MITLSVNEQSRLSLLQSLELLALSSGKKRKLFRMVGQAVRREARLNLRQQKTVTGQKMAPRKKGRKKVLRKLGKRLTTRTTLQNVTVTYKSPVEGRIAYRHQHGLPETFTAARMRKIYGRADYKGPATRKQAKALIRAGFRVYTGKGKSGRTQTKKPAVTWIIRHLTKGYAGYMTKVLQREQRKTSWQIKTPARAFLGMDEADVTRLITRFLREETIK